MHEITSIALKGLAGGTFVVLFSLIAEVLKPKKFAGIFAAAPSVALASLLLTSLMQGVGKARPHGLGMLIGSAGMVVYCFASMVGVERTNALLGSLMPWAAWFVVSIGIYL